MPFARWIKNQNGRPVCVWNDDMKMSLVLDSEIAVKSEMNEVVVAIFTTVPFGSLENIRTVNALSNFCKRVA